MNRPIAEMQLSGKSYKNLSAAYLLPAQKLWSHGKLADWIALEARYSAKALQVTRGRITYGPQNQGVKNKFGSDAEKRLRHVQSNVEANHVIGLDELKDVRDWKMIRNRVRNGWLQINENSDVAVRVSTKLAFEQIDEWSEDVKTNGISTATGAPDFPLLPFQTLDSSKTTGIFGLGPATASLVLSLRTDHVPFYGEEIIRAAGVEDFGKYSMRNYQEFWEKLYGKRREILLKAKKDVGMEGLTVGGMERAIWASVYLSFENGGDVGVGEEAEDDEEEEEEDYDIPLTTAKSKAKAKAKAKTPTKAKAKASPTKAKTNAKTKTVTKKVAKKVKK